MVIAPSGNLDRVQVPDAGNPLNETLPVDKAQSGSVMTPTTGMAGDPGAALITITADGEEVHPSELETV